jgi:hypothetical protein
MGRCASLFKEAVRGGGLFVSSHLRRTRLKFLYFDGSQFTAVSPDNY